MEGWIKLYRQLSDNPIWFAEKFTRGQAWVDLLLLANHKDSYFYKRGVKIDVKKGQIGRSEVELSDRWKWSRSKVRKFLNDLEKEQQIIQHKTNVTQLITVLNWCKYQTKEQQTGQQKDSRKTAKEQQKDTYKNEENEDNVNNEKEKYYRKFKHLKLSFEEHDKLLKIGYSLSQINSILDSIENYKKNTNYTSLYLTAIKWLKKEYPEITSKEEKPFSLGNYKIPTDDQFGYNKKDLIKRCEEGIYDKVR